MKPTTQQTAGALRVVVVGGGIAGLETVLALADMAGDRVAVTLVTPDPDFVLRPLMVVEPFGGAPAAHRPLESLGCELVAGELRAVDAARGVIALGDGAELPYDALVVCIGARPEPPFAPALTFGAPGSVEDLAELLRELEHGQANSVAWVVPPGVAWSLPLYELALGARRRAPGAAFTLLTPESAPLEVLGVPASDAVRGLLARRGIELVTGTYVHPGADGALHLTPGDRPLAADRVVTLPRLRGPAVSGLPGDADGFIPVDAHGRVPGLDDVYAAGDGTTFPIKQGGLAALAADAIAERLAARAGADVDPVPFHPVIRGMLFTADESLSARHDLTGGDGDGEVSLDRLWWPPQKVAGRYLGAWLAGEDPSPDLAVHERPLAVEVAVPYEWHATPLVGSGS